MYSTSFPIFNLHSSSSSIDSTGCSHSLLLMRSKKGGRERDRECVCVVVIFIIVLCARVHMHVHTHARIFISGPIIHMNIIHG